MKNRPGKIHSANKTDAARLQSLIENSADAIISADASDKILLWNPAAERMFGYTAGEAAKVPLSAIIPEKYRERHKNGVERFVKTESPVLIGKTVSVEGIKKGGAVFPIELSLSAVKTDGSWIFTTIIRDITERKRSEELIQLQNAQLNEVNSELSALFEVSTAISSAIDMEAMLLNVLKTVTRLELFDVKHLGGVFIIEGDRLRLAAHLGHSENFLSLHKNMHIGECLCGVAAKTGELIVSANSEEDARHTIRYSDIKPHGHIIVPLKAEGGTLGVLYLYVPVGTSITEHQKKLLLSIGNQLGVAVSNSKLYEKTKTLSMQDPLTGLANRRMMHMEINRNISKAKRHNKPFSAVMADVDHFKKFNDAHGHIAGDNLLTDLSALLVKTLRGTDLVVRYGGEEFLLLLSETDSGVALKLAERIRRAVEEKCGVTISLGVAAYNKEMKNGDELIDKADSALYRAKQNGRNRVETAE